MGEKIRLKNIRETAPADADKAAIKLETEELLVEMAELQNRLYASGSFALLVILQGMDASGKDGAIRKVFSSVNPQGTIVHSFKVPTPEEAAHDFLWRIHSKAPAKGMIHVFNRSHYEDVLVTRVHKWCDDVTAFKRMKAINDFEELLSIHGQTHILKFYLHISKKEQHQRLTERIHDPTKQWKYNVKDFDEAALFDLYQEMYEDCFEKCNLIPWRIVPSDQNWYKEHVMVKTIVETLRSMDLQYPGLKK